MTKLIGAEDIYKNFKHLADLRTESIVLCLLDYKFEICLQVEVGAGNERAALLKQEEFISHLIQAPSNAKVILIHNHPFDEAVPSESDHDMTTYVESICDLIGRSYMDHIIIGKEGYFSFNSGVRTKYVIENS